MEENSDNKKHLLEYLSDIEELMGVHEFMKDDDIDKVLLFVVKLIADPNIPQPALQKAMLQLQAISGKMAFMKTYYRNIATDKSEVKRKNVCYTVQEICDDMVAVLKYAVKGN